MKLFLLHPAKKFYIRQLARELKLQVNSVRRELENLEEFGLLVSSLGVNEGEDTPDSGFIEPAPKEEEMPKKRGKKSSKIESNQEKKYYQANADFLLFEEIKALIVKAQVLHKDELIEKIKKTGKVRLLILTGIFSGNTKSPVDVLVVGRVEKSKLQRVVRNLENDLGREINYTLMDSREFKYRRDMTDVFLYSVLEGRMIVAVDDLGLNSPYAQ